MFRWYRWRKTRFVAICFVRAGVVALPFVVISVLAFPFLTLERPSEAQGEPALDSQAESPVQFQFGDAMIDYASLAKGLTEPAQDSDAVDTNEAKTTSVDSTRHRDLMVTTSLSYMRPQPSRLLFQLGDARAVDD